MTTPSVTETTASAPDPSPPTPALPPRGSRRRNFALLGLVVAGLGMMWVFAFARVGAPEKLNTLDDPAFGRAAERICDRYLSRIDSLPRAEAANTPAQRATMVTAESDLLAEMVGELRDIERPPGRERAWVASWLDDWDSHVADRRAYAQVLRRGERDTPFTETVRDQRGVSAFIKRFAQDNSMDSCAPPDDI